MNPFLVECVSHNPIIPVVAIDKVEHAEPVALALLEGGISVIEVTLRTQAALSVIEEIAKKVPQMRVGAGTVLDGDDFKAAVNAGSQFIVSPGLTDELYQVALSSNVPLLPGAVTASEVMKAKKMGYDFLKFFPAQTSGGVAAIKALAGPFASIKFCPTGGITPDNATDYLALKNVLCVGGSWLVSQALCDAKQWKKISELANQSLLQVGVKSN